jgi:hypothetical protein
MVTKMLLIPLVNLFYNIMYLFQVLHPICQRITSKISAVSTKKMARTFSAFYPCVSIVITMLFAMAIGSNNNNHTDYKVFAITDASSIPKAKDDTFSAIGAISSLVITIPKSGFNITNAFKVILSGEWNLSVHKGNVTNFAANFLATPMDGTKSHIHQITNFKKAADANSNSRRQQIVQLTPDNSLSINGIVDVKINGVIIWHHAHVSILISKGNKIAIILNDKDTQNHFGKQPVLGTVSRLIL